MPGTKAKYSVFIDAKPDDVFAYVSDLSKHGEWADDPLQITAVDDSEIASFAGPDILFLPESQSMIVPWSTMSSLANRARPPRPSP